MPILDTAVLFAAADPEDKYHKDATSHMERLGKRALVAASGLLEFDIVLRARGFSPANRRAEFRSLIAEFPRVGAALSTLSPRTFYVAATLEDNFHLGYFDSLVAAEAMAFDGRIVSSDRDFDGIPTLERIALRGDG